jgi:hypothetical protein
MGDGRGFFEAAWVEFILLLFPVKRKGFSIIIDYPF